MAYTINRRLSTLVDSNGQLNTGKIPNDYIDGNHIADNTITTAMLHTSFTVSSSNLSSIDTDAVSEGSTNLYHTSERVDDRVASLLTAGTGITLTYDDAANTLTIAGAAQYGDSDVESYLSGGTGVTFSSGVISIGQAVGTSDNVQFNNVQVDGTLTSDDITSTNISIAGNATITGNLTVSGTTTTVNSNTVNIGDNILVLNSDETGTPSQDAGFEIERGTSTNKTLIWNETSDKWTVGSETFVAGTFEGALTGDVTGTVSDISNHDTDSLSEGSTNLYYTDARVESYLDGGTSTPTFASGIISGDLTVDTNTLFVDSTNNRVGIGNATPDVSLDIGSFTDAMHVPVGTTAQRPGSPAAGYFRYNSTTSQFEGYTTEWGAIAGSGGSAMETDTFTGDGSTTAFTLSTAASSEDNLIVFIEGVYQNKDDYVVSGTTLTFDVAPVNTRKIVVHHVKDSISGNNMILNQFSGDGSTTAFTLTVSLTSENNSQVYIDGVYQQKDSYTVGGTTLTFDTAPVNGTTIEVMIFTQTTINVPTANSIGISELNVSDGTSGQVLTTNGSGTLSFSTISGYTDSDVETYLNTSEVYTDPTNNRLGIGTSSPQHKLDIEETAAGGDVRINLINADGVSTVGNQSILHLGNTGSDSYGARLTSEFVGTANVTHETDLIFHTTNSSSILTEALRIDSSGVIGINNSNPYGTSQITVNTGTKDFTIYSESTDVNNYICLRDSTSTQNIIFGAEGDAHVFKADGITRASMGSTYTLKLTGGGGGSNLTFETTDASNNQTFFINDGGRAGVRYSAFSVGKNSSTSIANNAAIDFSSTNTAMAIPYGSTGQRSASPSNAGYMRWNHTLDHIENWSGTGWGSIGGKSQGEQLARQYCARTGGLIRYVSAGSGSLNSDLDAISDGDALLIAPGSYTITRKTSGYISEHNPFREKECGIFGDTNFPGDVTISHNADADTDIRDHPIWCARWNGLYTHPLFLGFIKYVRNPSTLNNTNYSDAIVNGTFSDGSTQMICGGAQNVIFDFNGTYVSWVYDNASATHYMRFKNCTFSNYNTWQTSYSGGGADWYIWHCVFKGNDNISGYPNSIGYDVATTAGSISNRTLLSKGNRHGVSLSGTGSNSGTYDVDTYAGAGHLQYDPFPTIFWDDENWPGDY